MVKAVTKEILQAYVGQDMASICTNKWGPVGQNHCAHFVSHALDLRHGLLCSQMASKATHLGASLRCNELYNALAQHGPWDEVTMQDGNLIFVTLTSNMTGAVMHNAPKKHVGIVWGGMVYNYGNAGHAVRCEATVDAFKTRMGHAYGGMDKVSFFYAVPQ